MVKYIIADKKMAESLSAKVGTMANDQVEIILLDALRDSIDEFDYSVFTQKEQPGPSRTENRLKEILEEFGKKFFGEFMDRLAHDIASSPEHQGRKRVQQLLGHFRNGTVCSWFDAIRVKLKRFIESLKELMVCFFCALFDLSKNESRHGRAACFYDMIKAHLKEKIPSRSTFQKALKWFKGWRKEVLAWVNRKAEEEKHRIWEHLHRLIMLELPRLEPRLVSLTP